MDAADSRIHTRRVAAAGKDTDSFHFHKDSSLFKFYKIIVSEEQTNVKEYIH